LSVCEQWFSHIFLKKQLKKKRGKLEKKSNFRKKIKNKWKKKWKVGGKNEKVQKKQKEEKVTKKRGMQCGLLFVIHNVLGVGEQWFLHTLLKSSEEKEK